MNKKTDISIIYNSKYRSYLFRLNKKFKLPRKKLERLIKNNNTDEKIYKELHNEHKKIKNKYNKKDITFRQKKKAELYGRIIGNVLYDLDIIFDSKKISYLDVGCEDFFIPTAIGSAIGATDVECINIEDWESKSYEIEKVGLNVTKNIPGYNKDTKYKFTYYDGVNIPNKNESIDLCSSFMVLHHVLKLDELLVDIHRVLKKGGVFVIREHDSYDKTYSKYLDIIHYYYDLVVADKPGKMIDYNTTYYTKQGLINKITNKGFKLLKVIPTKYSDAYFAFFMKN